MESNAEETRHRIRYLVRGELSGHFGPVEMTVCDLSESGLQLEHATPLKVGTRARGAIQWQGQQIHFRAVVTRSKLSPTAGSDGKPRYRSGARFDDPETALFQLIARLRAEDVLFEDPESLERKRAKLETRNLPKERAAMRLLHPVSAIPPDQLLLVHQARERLRAHPEEAIGFYNRARFVTPEHASLLAHSPFRDEILVVWEYLERSVELSTVAASFHLES